MRVLDLFSGLGGFSQAFKDRGHDVITVDNDYRFNPSICIDVRNYNPKEHFDVILASPPCIEFSRESMPWLWTGKEPSLELLKRSIQIIEDIKPSIWVIENVRGAVKWFEPLIGKPIRHIGSRYLWGEFPMFDALQIYGKARIAPSPNRAAKRALIPYSLSFNLCVACEREFNEVRM